MYDKIQINVCGLESIGVTAKEYRISLIPVIMSKLPPDMQLQIARVTGNDDWNIQELLAVIKLERSATPLWLLRERLHVDNYVTREFIYYYLLRLYSTSAEGL